MKQEFQRYLNGIGVGEVMSALDTVTKGGKPSLVLDVHGKDASGDTAIIKVYLMGTMDMAWMREIF